MDRTGKTILVVGATGRQGRTTIRHLVTDGWNVRALSRNIEAPAALALRREGVHVETIRWQNADVAGVYDFLNTGGLRVDIASLRRQHPDLMDFRTWLEKDGATLLQALPQKS